MVEIIQKIHNFSLCISPAILEVYEGDTLRSIMNQLNDIQIVIAQFYHSVFRKSIPNWLTHNDSKNTVTLNQAQEFYFSIYSLFKDTDNPGTLFVSEKLLASFKFELAKLYSLIQFLKKPKEKKERGIIDHLWDRFLKTAPAIITLFADEFNIFWKKAYLIPWITILLFELIRANHLNYSISYCHCSCSQLGYGLIGGLFEGVKVATVWTLTNALDKTFSPMYDKNKTLILQEINGIIGNETLTQIKEILGEEKVNKITNIINQAEITIKNNVIAKKVQIAPIYIAVNIATKYIVDGLLIFYFIVKSDVNYSDKFFVKLRKKLQNRSAADIHIFGMLTTFPSSDIIYENIPAPPGYVPNPKNDDQIDNNEQADSNAQNA
ncbi:hypothetical protein TVAG_236240 [Trichomonas vaginalis G3]|uniref:Uncharacterized protein n=1 Tax=Trichomonas vaginalis (strain ATCC PRA-98 / G3) TaxID=412133 RepID=A2G337_TRIV3|nr:hypothetical protein TVAGG3_0219810 [Trichomonas vaginalis G3]EAX88433.1 hypothetical protein TVAG_236240 [Trichomonas vaginalis G3]KAI5551837.1 hypothetical protein TVAGG3_0219810 [Trichomonas vaginalis G3]|eukprot:XP_001301363.1 hypothetical protein [Trichomonas vaginalis G3]